MEDTETTDIVTNVQTKIKVPQVIIYALVINEIILTMRYTFIPSYLNIVWSKTTRKHSYT